MGRRGLTEADEWPLLKSVQHRRLPFGDGNRSPSTPHRAVEVLAAVRYKLGALSLRVRSLQAGMAHPAGSPRPLARRPSTDSANDGPVDKSLGQSTRPKLQQHQPSEFKAQQAPRASRRKLNCRQLHPDSALAPLPLQHIRPPVPTATTSCPARAVPLPFSLPFN